MAVDSLHSHREIRCLLKEAEKSLTSLNKRIKTMEGKQQQEHKKIRAALKDKEKETEAIKERINEMNVKHQKIRKPPNNKESLRKLKNRLQQIEENQHEQNRQLRSALDQEETHLSLVKESFKQITDLQKQKHDSVRSNLHEEEERLRSSNVNSSTCFHTVTRAVRWFWSLLVSCFTNFLNWTGNQNPSNEIESDHEDQHHAIRSALKQEKEKLDSLQPSIEQIEEIQREEDQQLLSALQPDEKKSQLQREDIKTADNIFLQKRIQILEDFQKHLNIRSSEKEEKMKLLLKRLDQIKNFFQRQHEEVSVQYVDEVQQQTHSERRASEEETEPLLQRSSCKTKEKERETEDFKRILKEKKEELKTIKSKLKEQQREIEDLQQRLKDEEMQHQNTRSALKEKDVEIQDLQERVEDMKNNEQKHHHRRSSHKENEDLKRIIKEKDEQLKLMRIQEKEEAQQKQHQLKSLKDKEKETEALKRIINGMDDQLQLMKSAFNEKKMENEALLQRVHEMEAQLQQSRSALTKKKDEHEKLNQRINEKDEQLQLMKSASKEKQKETETLLQRVHELEAKLQKSRSAVREKDEQLKSFKDRVAGEVALSIKTGKTMSLNNPVNKNRLKEMYEDLRCDWPKIKKNLKSNKKHPDSVKELILNKFQDAKIDMRNRRKMIDKVFEKGKNDGGTPQKVDQYRQLTVQNLQMTLYSQKQDAGSQKPFLENEAANPQDVLKYLGSECYWLGCLMALNNPPLQPDWENHPPSMDRWDVFPRNIKTASDNE